MIALRHNCQKDGCFNLEHRLNFSVFDDCWQRNDWREGWKQSNIRPMDIDCMIEQRGNFLFQEWKSSGSVFNASSGQGIAFRRLAALPQMTVVLVQGSAKTMDPERIAVLSGKYDSGPLRCDLGGLKKVLNAWSRWADRNHAPTPRHEDAEPPWLERLMQKSS